MKEMGLQCYRLGVEWARLEPSEGQFDAAAFGYYRALISELIAAGIEPLVTLHHFTNPMWFENKGAFTRKGNFPIFLRFVREAVVRLGDLISEYITVNEPNVYAVNGYVFGQWPPGVKSIPEGLRVMRNMALCHIEAYKLIHRLRSERGYSDTKVSFAHHVRVFDPGNPIDPRHRLFTYINRSFFQDRLWETCGNYCDFIAINYYTRSTVMGKLGETVPENAPKNDLGWEIYPHGVARCARALYKSVKKPIYITENGTCDNSDAFRTRYIYEHLKVLHDSGLPVERYYHWCFTDNFEWLEGETARFGLVHVDYETQTRSVKRSGEFYSEIIRNGGVTRELYDKYVREIEYHR
jgi:beta-glucosidase